QAWNSNLSATLLPNLVARWLYKKFSPNTSRNRLSVIIPSLSAATLGADYGVRCSMLDLGWAELMFLAVLALIVVGPQDLPKLARAIGKLWGKAQRLYRDSLASIRKLETEMDL